MIEHEVFEHAAKWVHARIPQEMGDSVHSRELVDAFSALAAITETATSTFLIPDLFPDVALDVLYVHDIASPNKLTSVGDPANNLFPGLSASALTAIGTAVIREMETTNSDMVRHELDGAEIIVSRPGVRHLILQATGTTLLTTE